jgi:hypothetical protein
MVCNVCQGTGFENSDQIPEEILAQGVEEALKWQVAAQGGTDASVCHCCGNGEDAWHGEPGQHYSAQDPVGKRGPYAYNGGLCECH